MYLVDTNIFLEVLLTQEKREVCKKFLDTNIENLFVSDLSLHTIGIILFRNNKEDVFQRFVNDVIFNVKIITLKVVSYKDLGEIKRAFGLDFDDAYQYKVAREHDLKMVTMDKDFEKVKKDANVLFLQDVPNI
ncbi:MAG TPA: type II toxin-antitoxin system VapC family toxin [Candidatus Brocadiia bacterium]|nr:PIN domain-containing protein [Planctomycetota bacterium]MDO8094130.1 PIN domain-containing protein [Candidatus Brocadiales bacterium]